MEALQRVRLEELAGEVARRRRVAEKRSGGRGLLAREQLLAAEGRLSDEVARTPAHLAAECASRGKEGCWGAVGHGACGCLLDD